MSEEVKERLAPDILNQVQGAGHDLGVFVKHFVKIAQTEEEDAVPMLVFDGMVLLQHGGRCFHSWYLYHKI